ncbi:hypothetical protein, partial [Parabacteroides sp.]
RALRFALEVSGEGRRALRFALEVSGEGRRALRYRSDSGGGGRPSPRTAFQSAVSRVRGVSVSSSQARLNL